VKPSLVLEGRREAVRTAAGRRRAVNPRAFGSAPRGEDLEGSDIDILVDALPGAMFFDLGGLQVELEEILGARVDLLTPGDLSRHFRERALAEAAPI
jgi:predicted nucleotidyltransferase